MKTLLLQQYLNERHKPLASCPARHAALDDLCREQPSFCAKALTDAATHASQKAQLLAGLLCAPIAREAIAQAIAVLSDAELLQVLDGLRDRRLNGRRVRELGLHALVGREQLAELAAAHRLRLVRVFKHLLGERTWASVCRFLELPSPLGERFLYRAILRFAGKPESVREVLCFLAGLGFDAPEPARKPWLVVPWLQSPHPGEVRVQSPNIRPCSNAWPPAAFWRRAKACRARSSSACVARTIARLQNNWFDGCRPPNHGEVARMAR